MVQQSEGVRADSRGDVAEPRHAPPGDAFGRFLYDSSVAIAVFGGLIVLIVMALTVASVVGRTALDRPLLGDSEIVEVGIAIALFCSLPYCHIRGANVIVDFFTMKASARTRAMLDLAMNAVFLVCVLVLTWRLAIGGWAVYTGGDNSMFLRIPLWWGYFIGFVVMIVWCLTCLHAVMRFWRAMVAAGARAP